MAPRASDAAVLILMGSTYVTGSSSAIVTTLLSDADYLADGYARSKGATLSTTDTTAILACNMLVCNLVTHYLWQHDGGQLSGKTEPTILTTKIKELIDLVLTDTTHDGAVVGDMLDEDA